MYAIKLFVMESFRLSGKFRYPKLRPPIFNRQKLTGKVALTLKISHLYRDHLKIRYFIFVFDLSILQILFNLITNSKVFYFIIFTTT